MAKLYPPNLEGRLPAFTGTTLVVPFSMNRAVGPSEVYQMHIIIRLINRDTIVWEGQAVTYDKSSSTPFARFNVSGVFTVGQFYRVQLAYVDKRGEIGYYSSVGIIKYTTTPTVTINDLSEAESNRHIYDYTGIYSQKDGDITEKLYSSSLKLWDMNNEMLFESPEIIHSSQNDILSYEAVEKYHIPYDLEVGKSYRICFYVTTINGLSVHSPVYRLTTNTDGGVEFDEVNNLILTATSNFTRGTVDLTLEHRNPGVKTLKGMFYISRTEDKTPYEWNYIRSVFFTHTKIKDLVVCDYTVEQGKTYIYAIQQYNNYDIYSSRNYSNKVFVDFEDYYITDQTRQLKVRFNPKISSMKNTIVESKINTIGSRYPYIVRSGVVNYKEFQLSGLVSYHMDDDEDFIKWKDLGISTEQLTRTTEAGELPKDYYAPDYNLTATNIKAERLFKLEVLDWLNNGEPKVLKTPTEGNYLVILMNVSMTPTDQLGRMIHTFNCSAYEVGPYDYDTLYGYNFYDLTARHAQLTVPQWKTIDLASTMTALTSGGNLANNNPGADIPITLKDKFSNINYINILDGVVTTYIDFKDMIPNTPVMVGDHVIIIGATGAYHAEVSEGVRFIGIPDYYLGGGEMVCQTAGPLITDFDTVHAYKERYVCGRQFNGSPSYGYNLIDDIQNTRTKIVEVEQVRLFKRNVIDVYADRGLSDDGIPTMSQPLYYDAYGTMEMPRIGDVNRSYLYDLNNITSLFRIHWLDHTNTYDDAGNIIDTVHYDMRNVTWKNIHEDGSISEDGEMHYYWTEKHVLQPNGSYKDIIHEFPVYSGYYYDPNKKMMIEDDFDLYTARFGHYEPSINRILYEEVNVEEKERLEYDKSFQPEYIAIHDGIIMDITYIEQVVIYSYEENQYLQVKDPYNEGYFSPYVDSQNYEQAYNNYMTFVLNPTAETTETYDVGGTAKLYSQCNTHDEQYQWCIQRNLRAQDLLTIVEEKYAILTRHLQLAMITDLTRG